MWREGPILDEHAFVKTGVLDDVAEFEKIVPTMEAYVCNKTEWIKSIKGAAQVERQPEI